MHGKFSCPCGLLVCAETCVCPAGSPGGAISKSKLIRMIENNCPPSCFGQRPHLKVSYEFEREWRLFGCMPQQFSIR